MGFFRYPGGKTKLKNQIADKLKEMVQDDVLEYREPFFGGGSIGLLIEEQHVWINDFDPGIAALWTTLIRNPQLLKSRIEAFKPSIAAFDEFKEVLTQPVKLETDDEIADFGFKKLAIHQTSYSGLGTKSGGPLGGRKQSSGYPIHCRWSPKSMCKKIDKLHERFAQISVRNNCCTNMDFADVIRDEQYAAIIYLDPPYYVKGNDLYQCGLTHEDHVRLANELKNTEHKWLLSYDDCPEIRELYSWADIHVIDGVNYSITSVIDKETGERSGTRKSELLICK